LGKFCAAAKERGIGQPAVGKQISASKSSSAPNIYSFLPVLVFTTVDSEPWIEASVGHLIITARLIVAAHIAFSHTHARIIAKQENQNGFDEEPRLFQTLGLRR
jgi:hypothetical protein